MSQFADDDVEVTNEYVFNINDPTFIAKMNENPPDIDPDDIPKQSRPAPVSDGVYWIKVRLRGDKKDPVYYKNLRMDPNTGNPIADSVVAILTPRVFDPETGQEKGFLKDWYASSATPQVAPGAPPKGSALTAICKLAGKPIRRGAGNAEIKAHVEQLFAEAGEDGILVLAKTQWIKSMPKAQEENGIVSYVFKDVGGKQFKEYEPEIRGEKKIKELAAKQGTPEDLAHIWLDPVTGEERTVQAQVQSIEDPARYNLS
jgi:hypothetical protein